ncbi:hypothetical protein [Legionella brunensis]|uniref:Dot/Icm system substrate protein LidA n=1 Tax=Legionella brunensis TaxID=29422 RepID=A0A0W0S0A4_9GAMM|nr:hypothetical protein [Legionella brunensis]KTC76911.1 Dot/Icm system substrate protein LidA [Legionella brunensis]
MDSSNTQSIFDSLHEIKSNFEELMGKFGLKSPGDVLKFFASKEGIEIIDHFIQEIVQKRKEEEMIALQWQEQQEERASLLHELAEEDEAKKEDTQHQKPNIVKPPPTPEEGKDKSKDSALDRRLASLNTDLQKATEEKKQTEKKYEEYDKNLAEVDNFISSIDSSNPKLALEAQIARLEGTEKDREKKAKKISDMIDKGNVTEAKAELEKLKAKNLQIGTLKDMLAVVNDKKVMYNKDGKQVNSFKEAAYIVPKDKQLVKEGEEFYLYDKNKKIDKTQARQDFLNKESEMTCVKDLVQNNRTIEMSEFDSKIANLREQLNEAQEEKNRSKQTPPMSSLSVTSEIASDTGLEYFNKPENKEKSTTMQPQEDPLDSYNL